MRYETALIFLIATAVSGVVLGVVLSHKPSRAFAPDELGCLGVGLAVVLSIFTLGVIVGHRLS